MHHDVYSILIQKFHTKGKIKSGGLSPYPPETVSCYPHGVHVVLLDARQGVLGRVLADIDRIGHSEVLVSFPNKDLWNRIKSIIVHYLMRSQIFCRLTPLALH